jgi:hypothetical protein
MRASTTTLFILLHLAAILAFMPTGIATAADTLALEASQPATSYYTTNGADPLVNQPSADEQTNKELKKSLSKKYKLDKNFVTIKLEHTQYGPKGRLKLSGKIVPPNLPTLDNTSNSKQDRQARAKAIADAFALEEMDLLGAVSPTELHVTQIKDDERGIFYVRYQRFIDSLALYNSFILIEVGAEGNIEWVDANIFPSPPELYEAVKKETLPETRIREIAEQNLREVGFDPDNDPSIRQYMQAEKVALPTPPYVAWKVESKWHYLIDAFTGNILEKQRNIRN